MHMHPAAMEHASNDCDAATCCCLCDRSFYAGTLLHVCPDAMDWTDVHYRQLARLISKHTWLWTEMVVDATVIHTPNKDRYLWFPPEQHPIVCQLGGSNPAQLAAAAAIVASYGYDEINLNCGCPSDRVAGAGCFGASLMLRPEVVGEACAAIAASSPTQNVTVKCRLGVDDVDRYEDVCKFIEGVLRLSPVRHFVIHSRKCHLKGLNPAQNRSIPPLKRSWVWALKRDFPEAQFSLNGGIESCHQAKAAMDLTMENQSIFGVMIGRAAYNYPWNCLADADRAVFGAEHNAATSRRQVLREYAAYADAMQGRWSHDEAKGTKYPNIRTLVKPILGMFHGAAGGKRFRHYLDVVLKQGCHDSVSAVLEDAFKTIPDHVLDSPPPDAAELDRMGTRAGLSGNTTHFDVGTFPMPPPYSRSLPGSAVAAASHVLPGAASTLPNGQMDVVANGQEAAATERQHADGVHVAAGLSHEACQHATLSCVEQRGWETGGAFEPSPAALSNRACSPDQVRHDENGAGCVSMGVRDSAADVQDRGETVNSAAPQIRDEGVPSHHVNSAVGPACGHVAVPGQHELEQDLMDGVKVARKHDDSCVSHTYVLAATPHGRSVE